MKNRSFTAHRNMIDRSGMVRRPSRLPWRRPPGGNGDRRPTTRRRRVNHFADGCRFSALETRWTSTGEICFIPEAFFVPEGRRILAGGANHRDGSKRGSRPGRGSAETCHASKRRPDDGGDVASPLRGGIAGRASRWLAPPASIRRPSGTKTAPVTFRRLRATRNHLAAVTAKKRSCRQSGSSVCFLSSILPQPWTI